MSSRRIATAISVTSLMALGTIAALPTTPAEAATKTVKAVETDFHIALSTKSFTPGTYIFDAENKGHATHALTITGPGLKNATTKDLSPGQSAKLKVTLKKGKYDIFCPVPGHKALGMNVNLVIGSSAQSSNTATTAKAASSGGYGY
jgi:uncharacterized cupredoxin-like copper-binding protein